ncbi:SDR family NAD(P)-dependent oxidoreductase [Pseudorhodoferax sp.]|uniref:SDR family NAD(P)-dependent oxidoreductase n=1 Tax=Pseudorhodoferax sp. TaxID=1993553 RepID=UPI002DD676D5|nr:SDR family NAD(P)-dependent oxidoreductase [Pseudorhodoferax sp.]
MTPVDLNRQVAIVTGGSRGMGKAIAARLLRSGAKVALWALPDEALRQAGRELSGLGDVKAVGVDVSDEHAVAQAMRQTAIELGPASILVNSAGISGPHVPLWQTGTADWRRVMDVNLGSAFFCCRAAIPAMQEARYGRIVNVASVAGKESPALLGAYAASKAAMISLTKTLGKELATSGILVNAITPGPTRTEMLANTPPEQVAAMLAKVPMQRLLEPDEVAAAVAWLVSRECSFTTGAVLDLSGGRASY